MSNGPADESMGTYRIPPVAPVPRRAAENCGSRQLNSSTWRSPTVATWGHSMWPNPEPGLLRGGRTSQRCRSGDTAYVIRALVGPGGDQHVPAVPAGVPHDPGVAPSLLVPGTAAEALVPAVVGGDQRGGRVLVPHLEVGRGGCADGLEEHVVDHGHAGVEQPPAAVRALDDAAGPGGHVVERRRLGRGHHVAH